MSDIENTMPTEKEVREKVTAELEADFEKRVDQRIAGARKKWENKRSREAAESLARTEKLKQIEEAADYDKYDYLIGMEERNRRNMLRILGSDQEGKVSLLLDYAERHGDIADPWYTGDFTTTYFDIVRGCEGFLTFLEQEGKL